jgi:transposase-like protein
MENKDKPACIYCKSHKVIKHGKTSTGNRRYRCRNCGKTWVLEKVETIRPHISDIVEAYLNGRTCRDLVSIYHSSPLRINQKIREFLEGVPHWEDYVDACNDRHEPRLIYLIGKTFSCSGRGSKDNTMYLGLAIDALSTVVLGYEIGTRESRSLWMTLLDRMNCRGIICPTFITNGSKQIEDSVNTVFPYSSLKITYHRAYRDKELECCISRLPINNKLINEALKAYDSLKNKNLKKYLNENNDKKIKDILVRSSEHFIKRLRERLDSRSRIRVDGIANAFQSRFEKFHMLKDDPQPVINGWIAKMMIQRLEIGFSRLALYSQDPCTVSFRNYSCGNLPATLKLSEDSPLLESFVIEIATRGLQIPVFHFKCEMKLDKCSLF